MRNGPQVALALYLPRLRMKAENRVVTLPARAKINRDGHEYISRTAMAKQLAELLGYAYAGDYDPDQRGTGHVYFVPQETLLHDEAIRLGIHGESDLFGGVVPDPVVATKAITHATVSLGAQAPAMWLHQLAYTLRDVVLPGYSAFSVADLRRAGNLLLRGGHVRIKTARGIGGTGQRVVADEAELEAAIETLDAEELRLHGVVVEQNIGLSQTYSVGELNVAGIRIAYYGSQRVTRNHHGHDVYGGSDLRVIRGRITDILALNLPSTLRLAVRQAAAYDAAITAAFPRFFASRRNYDVLQGLDPGGRFVSGVLEQSWRIGGASPAEIAALEAFKADPQLQVANASVREIYTAAVPLPAHAQIIFHGVDEHVGWLLKYCLLETGDYSVRIAA